MEQKLAAVSSVHLQMSYTAQSSELPTAHPHLPVYWATELTNWLVLSHFRICHVPCQDSHSPTAASRICCQVSSWWVKRYSNFRLYTCLYLSKTIQNLPTVQVSIAAKWYSACRLYSCLYISKTIKHLRPYSCLYICKTIQHLPTVQLTLYQQKDTAPSDCTAVFISAKRYITFRLNTCPYISKTIQRLPTVQLSLYQQHDTAHSDCTAVCISEKLYSAFRLHSCLYISKTIQHLPTAPLSIHQ